MSSSDSASSDDERKIQQAAASSDSDSDSDPPRNPKKQAGSNSSGSDSEVEKPVAAPAKKKVLSKRKRKTSGSSDDDQVDGSLFTDKEDKARWKGLSELEKEREIFERMEARESARAREEIAQQLAKKAKKNEKGKSEKRRKMNSGGSDGDSPRRGGVSDSDSDMDSEFHRPSDINRKNKEKNAMDALKNKRREIEKKNAKKKDPMSLEDVFGAANSGSSSSSSSSESSRSSSSSRESSPERAPEQEKVIIKEVDTLAELRRARLSRHKLSLMIHAPFFDSTVVGCYVRLGQGQMSGSESKYRIWKIVGVEETNKIYDLEGKKTNKSIKCQFGKSERPFRMQFVSNSEFEQVEFDEWLNATKTHGTVPTVDVMDKKRSDIDRAVNHKYSDKEVDAMIIEKSKFQKVTRNFAMTKAGLAKQKELAQQRGDIREAERVQKEIDEIERHADELDQERSKSIRGIALINHRNRTQIKNQVLSGKLKIEENNQDDPFTRKKGGMRIVSGSKSKLDGTLSASSSITNLAEAASDNSSMAKSTLPPPVSSMDLKKKTNMSSLHDFDLDIDFDKLKDFSTPDTSSKRPSVSGPSKTMSMNDYRMRRGGGGDAGPST